MSFNWETEEDVNWDEEPLLEPVPEKEPSRISWRGFVLILLMLGVLAGGVIWYRVGEQIETAETETAVELLTSYDLLTQSAQARDVDLFTSFLSGRSEVWATGQATLVADGVYFDRPTFNLDYIGLTEEPEFTFAPSLMTAEMHTLTAYAFPIGNGITETVVFSQTAVFRRGETKWLYSPPDAEFWGEGQTIKGQLLHIQYPARDEAVISRLAPHLESKLFEACRSLQVICPEVGQFKLTFSMNADSLSPNFPSDQNNLVLPTPSLLGAPMNEVGYLALQQGYTQQLITALLTPAPSNALPPLPVPIDG